MLPYKFGLALCLLLLGTGRCSPPAWECPPEDYWTNGAYCVLEVEEDGTPHSFEEPSEYGNGVLLVCWGSLGSFVGFLIGGLLLYQLQHDEGWTRKVYWWMGIFVGFQIVLTTMWITGSAILANLHHSDDGVTEYCPAGAYCYGGSSEVESSCTGTPCPAGHYCHFGAFVNTRYPSWTGNEHNGRIFECPAGFYCPIGSKAPTACPEGYYSTSPGAASISTCIICPAGSYCELGAGNPTTCPAGSYCPFGTSLPSACPVGIYSLPGANLSTQCDRCASGFTNVSSTCVECRDQKVSDVGAVGTEGCRDRVPVISSKAVAYGVTGGVTLLTLMFAYSMLCFQRQDLQLSWTSVALLGFTGDGFFVFVASMLDFLSDLLYFLTERFYSESLQWSSLVVLCLPQVTLCFYILFFRGNFTESIVYTKCCEFVLAAITACKSWCAPLPPIYAWHIPFGWDDHSLRDLEKAVVVALWNALFKPVVWLGFSMVFSSAGLLLLLVSATCLCVWLCLGFAMWNLKLLIYEQFSKFWLGLPNKTQEPADAEDASETNVSKSHNDAKSRAVVDVQLFVIMELAELVLEDLPQVIIQTYNNHSMERWSTLAIVSVVAQACVILRLTWAFCWSKFKLGESCFDGSGFLHFVADPTEPERDDTKSVPDSVQTDTIEVGAPQAEQDEESGCQSFCKKFTQCCTRESTEDASETNDSVTSPNSSQLPAPMLANVGAMECNGNPLAVEPKDDAIPKKNIPDSVQTDGMEMEAECAQGEQGEESGCQSFCKKFTQCCTRESTEDAAETNDSVENPKTSRLPNLKFRNAGDQDPQPRSVAIPESVRQQLLDLKSLQQEGLLSKEEAEAARKSVLKEFWAGNQVEKDPAGDDV